MDLMTDTVRISHENRICQNLCLHTSIPKIVNFQIGNAYR